MLFDARAEVSAGNPLVRFDAMTRRIAIVLEAHTRNRTDANSYFDAWSVMAKLLAHAGIDPAHCLVTHLVDRFVDPMTLKWAGEEVQQGVQALEKTLDDYQPHFVLLLDRSGLLLRAFTGEKKSTDDWRGSVLLATHITPGVKVMATYSPKRLVMDYGLTGVVRFDLKRAYAESRTDELVVPEDSIFVDANFHLLISWLERIKREHTRVAIDIEGYVDFASCIGFATGHNEAFVVPFMRADGTSWWTEEEEVQLWEAVAAVLKDPQVPKVLQNSLYDCFVLAWSYGIVIEGIEDDTMLKHFELFCEMEKSLGFQTSIYTKHPYYKFQRKSDDERIQLEYCGRDCCRTLECCDAQEAMLKPQQREHYRFNLSLLAPLLYMELRGISYDAAEAQRRLAATQTTIYELQDEINREAAQGRPALRVFYEALGVSIEAPHDRGERDGRLGERGDGRGGDKAASAEAGAPLGGVRLQGAGDTGGGEAGAAVAQSQQDGVELDSKDEGATRLGESGGASLSALLPLLTAAFCCCERDRKEKREVEERRWQPMRLNAKGKWVKDGKLIDDGQAPSLYILKGIQATGINAQWTDAEPPTTPVGAWIKPMHRLVTRNVPVAITSLEDVARFALASKQDECKRALRLLRSAQSSVQGGASAGGSGLCAAKRGELATLLGIHVKISAYGRDKDEEQDDGTATRGDERDANWYLYEHCKLAKQWIKDGNRNTDRLASDAEAVIKAWIASGKTDATRDPRALTFIKLKKLLTETKSLRALPDADGRIRCSYNLVGTETHRLSCSGSPTRSTKLNLQTVTKSHRVLYMADEGHHLCQRDLSGADGWTVAAYAAMLGDRTMLDDYRAKLKPAQIIVLMVDQGTAVNQLSREALRPLCKPITEEADWRYFAMKRVQHGSSYMMGKMTTSDQILTDSFKKDGKPIYMPPATCERIQQQCFFVRYPGIPRLHVWMKQEIITKGVLTASNGFTRRFFGRKDDSGTLRQALAHLPQVYTTYATTLALHRLWTDPENRADDGALHIEPLHTVHDSLLTQWRIERTEWAREKMGAWFENEMLIAQERITIPASGSFGISWGQQDNSL